MPTIDKLRNQINNINGELESLNEIDRDSYLSFVASKFFGTVLPIGTKAGGIWVNAEAGLALTSVETVLGKMTANQVFEKWSSIVEKSVDIIKNYKGEHPDRIGFDITELAGKLEGEKGNGGRSAALFYQFLSRLKDGEKKDGVLKDGEKYDALANAYKSAEALGTNEEKKILKPLIDIFDLASAYEEGMENLETSKAERRRMREMIENRRAELFEKKRRLENNLFHLSGGKEGALNTGPKSANVFTRIDELLEEINMKIQRVQNNL